MLGWAEAGGCGSVCCRCVGRRLVISGRIEVAEYRSGEVASQAVDGYSHRHQRVADISAEGHTHDKPHGIKVDVGVGNGLAGHKLGYYVARERAVAFGVDISQELEYCSRLNSSGGDRVASQCERVVDYDLDLILDQ